MLALPAKTLPALRNHWTSDHLLSLIKHNTILRQNRLKFQPMNAYVVPRGISGDGANGGRRRCSCNW